MKINNVASILKWNIFCNSMHASGSNNFFNHKEHFKNVSFILLNNSGNFWFKLKNNGIILIFFVSSVAEI